MRGDELQGIKRGILEVVDVLVINKADGANREHAKHAQTQYRAALRLMRGHEVLTLLCSAREGEGIRELWKAITEKRECEARSGELQKKRAAQNGRWMWALIHEGLQQILMRDEKTRRYLKALEEQVQKGEVPPTSAAASVLDTVLGEDNDSGNQ